MSELKGETAPALGVSLNAQLDARRQLVFQTHVDASTSEEDLSKLVDKLNRVVDRQVAYYSIEELENALERDKQILYSVTHNLETVEANIQLKREAGGKRGEYRMSQTEVVQKKQAEDSAVRQKEIVAMSERRLAEAKKKAGIQDGSSSAANN